MITQIIAVVLLLLGFFLIATAVIGVLRFPDFYSRLHAASKVDSLGVALTLTGLAVYNGLSLVSVKLMLIVLFVLLTNPLAAHLLAKAAYRFGVTAWKKEKE
ncbi:MAG: monovalent cation/H(+) antiporter subunit G [Clostridiales bacterium]|nr:monovalent cation/H(+) antiporter subunit G [Clostridiales bacterium]